MVRCFTTSHQLFTEHQIKESFQKFGKPPIQNLRVVRAGDASIVPVNDDLTWAQAYLTYETTKTRGKGLLRLKEGSDGKFEQAFTFFTTMWEVKGHEEFAYDRRPNGADIHSQAGPEAKNWKQLRAEKIKFEDNDPVFPFLHSKRTRIEILLSCLVDGPRNRRRPEWPDDRGSARRFRHPHTHSREERQHRR